MICVIIHGMDPDKRKRVQSLKVIISEAIMVIAVILMVTVLALIVSGYWLNSDFQIERQGLLQISSVPTGASINIDGDSSWLQKTNTSKVLSSGEHTIVLSKDGYDTWSKKINITEGLLYRLHYPRLFLQNRSSESVFDLKNTIFASVSPEHDKLVLVNESSKWDFLELDNETLTSQKIDIKNYLSDVGIADSLESSVDWVFHGKIFTAEWDNDGSHLLLSVENDGKTEWVLLDVKNPKNSVNISKAFGANFERIKILDNASNNLLAIQNGNLHKIDVSGKSISSILVKGVINFDHYNNEIIFSAKNDGEEGGYYLGLTKIGDNEITNLSLTSSPEKVVIYKFYDEKYIATLFENSLSIFKEENFEKIFASELSFSPENLKVGHNSEFAIMNSGSSIATFDMESLSLNEWTVDGEKFGWVDNSMIFSVSDGNLIVYDFDGNNRRELAKNVSNLFPAMITDNKWLYYFNDTSLMREWLIPR